MKKVLILTIVLVISFVIYSQNKVPKGMTFCPSGTFIKFDSDSVERTVSPFLISNEITNKEYRDFYTYIKKTPADTIYWIDYKEATKYTKSFKDGNVKSFVKKVTHKDILSILIDESVWTKDPSRKDYFFDTRYNNYPVIGVTFEGARFYCIWRTNKENKKRKARGKPYNHDYRIPLEAEWEYAASFNEKYTSKKKSELQKVSDGTKNKIGIYNLFGNVSEWIVLKNDKQEDGFNVYRGGSYKSGYSSSEKGKIVANKSTDYIGFRVVQTFIDKK